VTILPTSRSPRSNMSKPQPQPQRQRWNQRRHRRPRPLRPMGIQEQNRRGKRPTRSGTMVAAGSREAEEVGPLKAAGMRSTPTETKTAAAAPSMRGAATARTTNWGIPWWKEADPGCRMAITRRGGRWRARRGGVP